MTTSLLGGCRRSSWLTAALLVGVLHSGGAEGQTPRTPHATGRLTYRVSGGAISAEQVLAWTENGKKIRQETRPNLPAGAAKSGGKAAGLPLTSWMIVDGDTMYMSNPMLGPEVKRMKVPKDGPGAGGPQISVAKNWGKVTGKGKIAGKDCEIREKDGNRFWVWQSLPLKMEMNNVQAGMNLVLEATKVELDVKVDPARFKVPAGVKVTDFDPHSLGIGGPGKFAPRPVK
jgi:hypothetical protein